MDAQDVIYNTKRDLEMEYCSEHMKKATVILKDGGGFQFEYCCEKFRDKLLELAQERMIHYSNGFFNS